MNFREFLEARNRPIRPHGAPSAVDPYRRGDPKRPVTHLELPQEKKSEQWENYFSRDQLKYLHKFVTRKAREHGVSNSKIPDIASQIMEWAKKIDPSGGSYMPWIISQIVKENIGISEKTATQINRVLSRYLEAKDQLKEHPNPLVRELPQKLFSLTPDEVEDRLALV